MYSDQMFNNDGEFDEDIDKRIGKTMKNDNSTRRISRSHKRSREDKEEYQTKAKRSKKDEETSRGNLERSRKDKDESRTKTERSREDKEESRTRTKNLPEDKEQSRTRSERSRGDKEESRKRMERSHRRSKSTRKNRSRSRSKSYRKRETSKRRERNRSRRRSQNRDKESRRPRSNSRTRCYAPDLKEIQDKFTIDEKDARTIYVWQLSQRVRTRDLEDLFCSVGKLCVVRLILDPRSGKSKGVAYIQFRNIESVDKAIGLNGHKLCGFPIMVRTVSSEKSRAAEASATCGGVNTKGPVKLCVSNLHEVISEDSLEKLFIPYGSISEIKLLNDINGKSSGTAFITFHSGENAMSAMKQMNNFEVANRQIKVTPVIESDFGNELSENPGVSMTLSARLGLMAKLAVGTGLKVTPATQNEEKHVMSTQCFRLQNMFTLDDVQDEESCKEIEEDIISECSKYGGILHIKLDKINPDGMVYIKCPDVPIAQECVNQIHGRSFDSKTVLAAYIPLKDYTNLFPESMNLKKVIKF